MRRFVAVLLVLCAAAPLRADDLRPLSLRELTYRAGAVVLAVPVEPASSGQFKVTHVLRGQVKPDTAIALTDGDRKLYSLAAFVPVDPENPKPYPIEALLFLAPAEQGKPIQLVPSGLFLCLSDGMVLVPRSQLNAGAFAMMPQGSRLWANVIRDTKEDAAVIDDVLRIKASPEKERTPALLNWVERHRMEFGGGFYDGERAGWGSLETDVFDWICASGRFEDCWAAQRLYAELNHGALLSMKRPCFGTPAARDFLLQMALNNRVLDGDRARAVSLLTHPTTLSACSDADLDVILQKLPPLLHEQAEDLRTRTIAALLTIHTLPGKTEQVQTELKNALPALQKAYRAEQPGVVRDLLVEAIHTIGGPEHWRKFSGNKAGVAVLLRDFDKSPEHYYFWLQVMPTTDKMYERPSLVLERLDAKEKVLETKTLPLPVTNVPKWEDGWAPADLLLVQFPKTAMTPSPPRGGPRGGPYGPGGPNQGGPATTWRITVRGTIGKDKVAWASEPKLVVTRPQAIPLDSYPYPIEDK